MIRLDGDMAFQNGLTCQVKSIESSSKWSDWFFFGCNHRTKFGHQYSGLDSLYDITVESPQINSYKSQGRTIGYPIIGLTLLTPIVSCNVQMQSFENSHAHDSSLVGMNYAELD